MAWFRTRKPKSSSQGSFTTGVSLDPEFDTQIESFYLLDEQLQDVHEKVHQYLDQLTAFCISGGALSDSLLEMFTAFGSPQFHDAALLLQEAHTLINNCIRGAVHRTIVERVVRPIGSLLNEMPRMHQKIKLRQRLQTDFQNVQTQLHTESSKDHASDSSLQLLAAKMTSVHVKFVQLTEDLKSHMELLEDNKTKMMMPAFSSFVTSQTFFYKATSEALLQIFPSLPQSSAALCILSSYMTHVQREFEEFFLSRNRLEEYDRDVTVKAEQDDLPRAQIMDGAKQQRQKDHIPLLQVSDSEPRLAGCLVPIVEATTVPTYEITNPVFLDSPSAVTAKIRPSICLVPPSLDKTYFKRDISEDFIVQSEVSSPHESVPPPVPTRRPPTRTPKANSASPRRPSNNEDCRTEESGSDSDDGHISRQRLMPESPNLFPNVITGTGGWVLTDGSPTPTKNPNWHKSRRHTSPNFLYTDRETTDNLLLSKAEDSGDNHLLIATAQRPFSTNDPGFLPFERGDMIKILRKDESGWWLGRMGGKEGLFPENYVLVQEYGFEQQKERAQF